MTDPQPDPGNPQAGGTPELEGGRPTGGSQTPLLEEMLAGKLDSDVWKRLVAHSTRSGQHKYAHETLGMDIGAFKQAYTHRDPVASSEVMQYLKEAAKAFFSPIYGEGKSDDLYFSLAVNVLGRNLEAAKKAIQTGNFDNPDDRQNPGLVQIFRQSFEYNSSQSKREDLFSTLDLMTEADQQRVCTEWAKVVTMGSERPNDWKYIKEHKHEAYQALGNMQDVALNIPTQ